MNKSEVIPELLKACPSFAETWACYDDADRELLYPRFGDFASHLLEIKNEGREDILRAAGTFIERMHVEGDDYVRELATIGALEGIQNIWKQENGNPEEFRTYLGPESRRWWDSLNKFWNKEIPYVGADIGETKSVRS